VTVHAVKNIRVSPVTGTCNINVVTKVRTVGQRRRVRQAVGDTDEVRVARGHVCRRRYPRLTVVTVTRRTAARYIEITHVIVVTASVRTDRIAKITLTTGI
jgi:hypothetical protein